MHQNTSSNRSSCTSHRNSRTRSSGLWTPWLLSSRAQSPQVSPNVSSPPVWREDITSWRLCNLSRRVITRSSIVFPLSTERTDASIRDRSSCRRAKESRSASLSKSPSSAKSRPAPRSCMRMSYTLATRMCVRSIRKTLVSHTPHTSHPL